MKTEANYNLRSKAAGENQPGQEQTIKHQSVQDQLVQNNEQADEGESSASESESEVQPDIPIFIMDSSEGLSPPTFSGRSDEDAEGWLFAIRNWLQFRRLNAEQAIAAVTLLFKGSAKQWVCTLTEIASVDALLNAFQGRYVNNGNKWLDLLSCLDVQQEKGQPIEDYISLVLQKASKAQMSNDQLIAAVLRGLRPEVRRQILTHDITSLDDVRKWGALAMLPYEGADETTPALAAELAKLRQSIAELKVTAVVEPEDDRSPSEPRRVRFSTYGASGGQQRSVPPMRREQSPYAGRDRNRGTSPRRSNNNFYRRRDTSRPRQGCFSQPPSGGNNRTPAPNCNRCGKFHRQTDDCRALNMACYNCGQRGHLRVMCRSAVQRRPQ